MSQAEGTVSAKVLEQQSLAGQRTRKSQEVSVAPWREEEVSSGSGTQQVCRRAHPAGSTDHGKNSGYLSG